jgi:hypothetical protein
MALVNSRISVVIKAGILAMIEAARTQPHIGDRPL